MIEILLALAAANAEPRTLDYAKCINMAAKDFEKSGESASDVAAAVEGLCRGLEPQPNDTNVLGVMTASDRDEVLAKSRASVRKDVLVYIMQYRSCKNTKGCSLESVQYIKPSSALEYLASDRSRR